jgi:hypothetical protein
MVQSSLFLCGIVLLPVPDTEEMTYRREGFIRLRTVGFWKQNLQSLPMCEIVLI